MPYPRYRAFNLLAAAALFATLAAGALPVRAAGPGPEAGALGAAFPGLREQRLPDAGVFRKWQAALRRHRAERADARWTGMLDRLRSRPAAAQAAAVNAFFNRLRYVADGRGHGRPDHWTSPRELLAAGAGDCEDFAIAKYFALRALGFPDRALRIVVAADTRGKGAHAFLLVDTGRAVISLDNRLPRPGHLAERLRYRPLYAVNASGAWLYRTATTDRYAALNRPAS